MKKWEDKLSKRQSLKKRWAVVSAVSVLIVVVIAAVFFLIAIKGRSLEEAPASSAVFISVYVLILLAAVISAVFIVNYKFIRDITGPILELKDAAQRIADGSYGFQVQKKRDDEIGDLIDGINEMSAKIAQGEKVKSEFISSVSHELRTPLTAITGWSETLAYDDNIQGESRLGISIISSEADRLKTMVGELLDFTRIQDGRFNLDMQTVDITRPLEDSVLTYGELLKQDKIELVYEPHDGPLPMIEADPERLKQVFLNILDNASKYGRDGGRIIVSTKLDGDFIEISLRDFGCGIPAEDLPHVKERFFKGKSKKRGSGIGLAVCEEIVMRHKGELIIENAEGGGVNARVRLPISN